MDWLPIVLLILGIPIGLAIWLIARAISARESINTLSRRLNTVELEILRLKRQSEPAAPEAVKTEQLAAALPSEVLPTIPEEPIGVDETFEPLPPEPMEIPVS